MTRSVTFVIPAKNEETGLARILPELRRLYPASEVIVVSDGSTDSTVCVARESGASVIEHLYSKGNGASIKSGVRRARGDIIVCMDADGQHQPSEVSVLLEKLEEGYDMVVGARNRNGQASAHRSLANGFYNLFASWMVGHKVLDLTSGFRAVYRTKFQEFVSLLPNGFSYPTTITMSFFRAGYSVGYVPIAVKRRLEGTSSHVSPIKDGLRFLLIIFKVGTLYSPLKLFLPVSLFFLSTGIGYYLYTYFVESRFTNMSALLLTTSVIIFLMGLVSEQITNLLYQVVSK